MAQERMHARAEKSRRAALIAARQILLEEGWEAVSQLRVAERSGVGRSTVYRHWPNRNALLLEVLNAMSMRMHSQPTGRLWEDLVSELNGFVKMMTSEPGWHRVFAAILHHASTDPEVRAILEFLLQRNLEPAREALERAAVAGELRTGIDPDQALTQLFGPLVYSVLTSMQVVTAPFIESLVDQFIAAHAPPQRRRRSLAGTVPHGVGDPGGDASRGRRSDGRREASSRPL